MLGFIFNDFDNRQYVLPYDVRMNISFDRNRFRSNDYMHAPRLVLLCFCLCMNVLKILQKAPLK